MLFHIPTSIHQYKFVSVWICLELWGTPVAGTANAKLHLMSMCGSNHDDNGEWHLSCSSGVEWGVGVVTKTWCQCVYEQQWSAVVVGCRAVLVWYSYMLQWLLSAVHLHPSQVDQFPQLIESHWWPGALLNISPCCPTLTTQTWSWSWNTLKLLLRW